MKKIFTLLAFISLAFGANAQRHVDIAVTNASLLASSSTYSTGSKFPFKCFIANNGPDTLRTSDSMQILVYAQYDTVWAYLNLTLSSPIAPGTTVSATDSLGNAAIVMHSWHGYVSDSTKTFCVSAIPFNRGATTSLTDPTPSNNTFCGPTMKLLDVHNLSTTVRNISVYPNPAQSNLNMDVNLNTGGNVSIRVLDVTGRMVLTEDKGRLGTGDHKLNINTGSLPNGVYIYQLMVDNESTTGRFSIAK